MSLRCRIIICGQSVFLLAIEASLAALPEMEVIRFNSHLPAMRERITALQPDIVIVEHDQGRGDLALDLLSQGLRLVLANGQEEQAMLLSGEAISIVDLHQMLFFEEATSR